MGMSLTYNLGDTKCDGANRLHCEFTVGKDLIAELCWKAMTDGRTAARLTKPMMTAIKDVRQAWWRKSSTVYGAQTRSVSAAPPAIRRESLPRGDRPSCDGRT